MTSTEQTPRPRGTQSAMRAIDILEHLADAGTVLTISEICDRTGLTESTAHRLSRALTARGLLVKVDGGSAYRLGSGLMRLALRAMSADVTVAARPILEELRQITGETVSLFVRSGSQRTCLVELPSPKPIRMVSGVGNTYPLTSGASGKAICALLPETGPDSVLRSAVSETELKAVVESGFAESVGETTDGAAAIATGFRLRDLADATEIYALNITGPSNRFTQARREECAPFLVKQAQLFVDSLSLS